ncbi:hypothetical protein EON64_16670, partial [archaeon]
MDRQAQPGALWSSKASGNFAEGDPQTTRFTIQGRVEIKELGGHMKAFFQNVQLKPRLIDKPKKDEDKDSDSSSDSDSSYDSSEKAPVEELIVVPKLHVYLTIKKPKKRMVDAHKLGTRIFLSHVPEGTFGSLETVADYEASLADIVDLNNFQGLVVLKMPTEEPMTSEPIIFGYVRFASNRALKIRSLDALQLQEQHALAASLIAKHQAGANGVQALSKAALRRMKPLKYYSELANQAWFSVLQKQSDELVGFVDVLACLDKLNLFLPRTQARRLFEVFDKDRDGLLGVDELENLLIGRELLGQLSLE